MTRLPVPGGDSGNWGTILNDFLSITHNADGSLKSGTVSGAALTDGSITKPKLSPSGGTNGQVLSTDGTNLTWSTPSGGSTPNATTGSVGVIQLAGDLAGSATAPTVPGLAGKANTTHSHNASDVNAGTLDIAQIPTGTTGTTVALGNHAHSGYEATVTSGTTTQYWRGDKSWQTLDKTAVGLANVDNTSDTNKPVSTAVSTALAGKANTSHSHAVADVTGLQTALDGKQAAGSYAASTHAHTTSDLSDFTEATQDLVSSTLVAGTNVNLTYNDGAGTLTVDATPGAGNTDLSTTRNATSVTVVSSTGNDAVIPTASGTDAGVLVAADKTKLDGIATSATANSSDATLLNRANHTGAQAQSTVTNLVTDLAGKASTSHTHSASDVNAGTLDIAQIPTGTTGTTVALGNHAHSGYEATVTSGTTTQYWRGDKSWQTLDKTAVGLANVDNTSDANKPVSTATQTALNAKANTSSLATVATSGSYNDLTDKPTIPKITSASSAPGSPAVGDMWLDLSA